VKIKLTQAQIQAIVNVCVTITVILLSLAGYTTTILDPAKDVIIERMDALSEQVEAAIISPPGPIIAGGSHWKGIGANIQATQTVTDDGSIDATGTYVPLTAIANVSSIYTVTNCAAGDILYLINTGSNTIGISDTGTMKLSGGITLGQYDTLLLWCDGTNAIEVSHTDN